MAIKKADNIEYLQRVRIVQQKMIEGHNSRDICNSIVKMWDIGERQAKNYIQEAYKDFKEFTAVDLEDKMSFHRAARLDMFKWAQLNGKKAFALKILDSMAKLDSLFVERKELNLKGNPIQIIMPDNGRGSNN